MFSGFLGKGKKGSSGSSPKDSVDSRGLEVVEDDPDTTWGLWENAVAELDSRSSLEVAKPVPNASGDFLHTVPLPIFEEGNPDSPDLLRERTPGQRKEDALQLVELHHHRIATTIRDLWGHKECSEYIAKLIMDGGDSRGNARLGFNQDAAAAMMALSDLHDELFGVMPPSRVSLSSNFSVRTGWDNNTSR